MENLKLSKLFNDAIDDYLITQKPLLDIEKLNMKFDNDKLRSSIINKLQEIGFFCQVDKRYPASAQKCDIFAERNNMRIFIELRQSGKLTDGFLSRDFDGYNKLEKLKDYMDVNDLSVYLGFNINPKYTDFPKEWKEFRNPHDLPCNNINLKAITRFWDRNIKPLHKDNCRLYLKEYIYPFPEELNNVSILTRQYASPIQFNSTSFYFVSQQRFL